MALEFVDVLPQDLSRTSKWDIAKFELKANPGRWARLESRPEYSARVFRQNLRSNGIKAFPSDEYEVVISPSKEDPRKVDIYLRYVGN